ncbi:MAG: hypothetical protein JJU37_09350, partial [Balneolaceae bacterium]|nr:hypothetical protein [Balneolaceae bacterium]
FVDCTSKIEKFINQQSNLNKQQLSKVWSKLQSQIQQIKLSSNIDIKILTAESPEVDFLIELYERFPSSFQGAYDYLILDRIQQNKNDSSYIRGVNLAYEFELQDQTNLLQRRNNEKKSLGLLRSNFEKYLSDAEEATTNYVNKTHKNFDEHAKKLAQLEKTKEEEFDKWFGNTEMDFNGFFEKSRENIANLEETYRENLRLEAPAQYWEDRGKLLRENGNWWTGAFSLTLFLIVTSLFTLLWLTPDGMFADLFSGEAHAIKWAVIYVTFLSFFAYGLRIFSKLAMSSYHLSRDAEERQQLTYVYLALKKDANVEEKDRLLILQSLFSRAETGLLKEDSNPTMPGNILNKINGS